jgi:predicted XRE-type DNA-binding protein
MGIAQPDLSNILHGKFRGFTVDRLTGMLARLGYGVDIILRPPAASEALRTVHVSPLIWCQ